jgi:hypothetical protein
MRSAFVAAVLVLLAGCDPVSGTGNGAPPDPKQFLHSDTATKSAVVTLIAGYPVGTYQFNYNGYAQGALTITVPAGWQLTVQCQNRGTIPNSCAAVGDSKAMAPLQPGWSTPDPQKGVQPGGSASFTFTPDTPGRYRIASLVPGSEASGMWAQLVVSNGGTPSISGSG